MHAPGWFSQITMDFRLLKSRADEIKAIEYACTWMVFPNHNGLSTAKK
jgi:hypothetical protein